MKILFASLKHQVRVALGERYSDNLRVGVDGVSTLTLDANCLVVNGKKAIPLVHVLEMDVEAGKR